MLRLGSFFSDFLKSCRGFSFGKVETEGLDTMTGYSPLTNQVQSDWGGLLLVRVLGRFEFDSGTRDNLRDDPLESPPGGQPRLFN
jgi:hypothetical protein